MRKSVKKTKSKKNKKPQKGFLFHLGNLLIIASLFSLVYIFAPVLNTYLFPKPIKPQIELVGDYITIPKISAQAPLIFNVDPWTENVYKKVLKSGVAHAKGTAIPGESGRSFIFAHSSGNPLELTRYNTVFLRLGDLKKGDVVEIKKDDKVYKYNVTQTKIVWPNQIEYLEKSDVDEIIIQTCWPIGTSFKRLLVFAAPTN